MGESKCLAQPCGFCPGQAGHAGRGTGRTEEGGLLAGEEEESFVTSKWPRPESQPVGQVQKVSCPFHESLKLQKHREQRSPGGSCPEGST